MQCRLSPNASRTLWLWSQADSLQTWWSMDFCGVSELAEIEIELRAPPSPARRRLKTGDMGGLERGVTLKSLA